MSNFELQPYKMWLQDRPNGDVALCDPYTGRPFKDSPTDLDTPPPVFTEDEHADKGYQHVRDAESNAGGNFQVEVLLVDPHDTESLRPRPGKLADHLSGAAAVGFATRRSVNQAGPLADSSMYSLQGLLTNPYAQAVKQLAEYVDRPLFPYDPPVDVNGDPATPAAARLQQVEDKVRELAWDQEDMGDLDLAFLATDLVYTKMLGSLGASQVGHGVHGVARATGKHPEKVVVLAAPELAALAHEIGSLGVYTTIELARPDLRRENPDYYLYPEYVKAGAISASFFEED